MAERDIEHVIPVDGFAHQMWGCSCHPDIHENATFAAGTNLEDLGVGIGQPGALTFVHKQLQDTGKFQIVEEVTDYNEEDEPVGTLPWLGWGEGATT